MADTGVSDDTDVEITSRDMDWRARTPRFKFWMLVVAWVATIGGLSFWLGRTPNGMLRDQLRRWQFWVLEIQFLLLLVLSWINIPRLLRSFELRAADFTFPALTSALAFVLTTCVAPQTSRIYYDEQIYQAIGQNLSDLRLAQMCNDGNVEYGTLQCWRGEYNKEPYGYPYLLSLAYRLVGVHESVAFWLNATVISLLVLVVFLTTTALTGRAQPGNYASLIVALIPEQLRWSHSAAAEPSAALACGFAVLTALGFVRMQSTTSLLWMAAATAFAVQFRPECVLLVPVVTLVALLYSPHEFRQSRLWWAGVMALALDAIHVGHLIAVRTEGWGTSGPRMSTMFLANNLQVNGWFYFGDQRFPILYSLLALTGLVIWRNPRAVAVLSTYFLLFWGIFLFFYAGSYNYGADVRFSLMTYPPLAMLAGVGTWTLVEALADTRWALSVSTHTITSVLCVQFLWYLPLVRTTGEEAWGARADVEFARHAVQDLARNSIVLTHNPNMFHIWGHSAAQASLATVEPGYANNVLAPRYAGGVFFHWNFWCNVADPVQQSFCTQLLDRFPHTLVREYRERDYRYALYRLDVGTGPNTDPR